MGNIFAGNASATQPIFPNYATVLGSGPEADSQAEAEAEAEALRMADNKQDSIELIRQLLLLTSAISVVADKSIGVTHRRFTRTRTCQELSSTS